MECKWEVVKMGNGKEGDNRRKGKECEQTEETIKHSEKKTIVTMTQMGNMQKRLWKNKEKTTRKKEELEQEGEDSFNGKMIISCNNVTLKEGRRGRTMSYAKYDT